MQQQPQGYRPAARDPAPDEHADGADQETRQRMAIEQMVSTRLRDAMTARESSGIEEIWFEDEDQYNGYDAVNRPAVGISARKDSLPANDQRGSQRSLVFLNITKPKTDSAVSRVQEMLVPTDDRPWEITNSPIPEFSAAIEGNDETMHTMPDGQQRSATDIAKAAVAKAAESAKLASDQIEDWFVEGNVYAELRKVIRDAGRLGSGVLKGPFPVNRNDKKWNIQDGQATINMTKRLAPTAKRISALDLFPDPSCGDNIHDGSFLFERDYLTARRIRDLARLPDYNAEAMLAVLKQGPGRRVRNNRYMIDTPGEVRSFDSEVFEVFYYYGDIPPEQLLSGGFVIPGLNDAQNDAARMKQIEDALMMTTIPVVCTLINDRLVRVSMNPMETGGFPFDIFPWEPVEGQPWGRGIPRKIAVAQRMLNAAVRALLENAGMSAGPQVVIDKTRVTPANKVYEITGRKLWYFTPSDAIDDVRKAFASVMIESAQVQLQAVIDFAQKMADELSNLPMLLQGIVGQTADTFGGMKMLEQNAASPLKAIAKQFDDTPMLPFLKRMYDWLMQDPNVKPEAKGDHQCRARGAGALASREQAGMFLAQSGALVKDTAFGINPKKWFEELCLANKFQPSLIQFTADEQRALEEARAKQPQPVAPQVEAAQINAKTAEARANIDAQIAQEKAASAERIAQARFASEQAVREMDREIEVMQFSGRKDISLDQMRAMLAKTAMQIRSQAQIKNADIAFHAQTGEAVN